MCEAYADLRHFLYKHLQFRAPEQKELKDLEEINQFLVNFIIIQHVRTHVNLELLHSNI